MNKPNLKLSLAAFIIGIISLVGSIIIGAIDLFSTGEICELLFSYSWQRPFYFILFLFSSSVGLILGVVSQKFLKKGLGVAGIILSIFTLLFLLFWYFVYSGFSHMQ